MNYQVSPYDLELLSAYLDQQLDPASQKQLEDRLAAGVEPREVLEFLASGGFEVRDVEHPDRPGLDAGRIEATGVEHYCNLLVSRHAASSPGRDILHRESS